MVYHPSVSIMGRAVAVAVAVALDDSLGISKTARYISCVDEWSRFSILLTGLLLPSTYSFANLPSICLAILSGFRYLPASTSGNVLSIPASFQTIWA